MSTKTKIAFTLTGARGSAQRLVQKVAQAQLQDIDIIFIVKWRETVELESPNEDGSRIAWGPSSSVEQMQQTIQRILDIGLPAVLCVEQKLDAQSEQLLRTFPSLQCLVSGYDLSLENAQSAQAWCKEHQRIFWFAVESEKTFTFAHKVLRNGVSGSMIVGTSYLSENSKMYDTFGLAKYRMLLKALSKEADKHQVRTFSTSNYCTFDVQGKGDKRGDYVREQINYMLEHYPHWGMITKFLIHMQWTQRELEKRRLS